MTSPQYTSGNTKAVGVDGQERASAVSTLRYAPMRLRAWALGATFLAAAPAAMAIFAFQIYQNSTVARSQAALAAIHSEIDQAATSNTIQIERVAASITKAITGVEASEPKSAAPVTRSDSSGVTERNLNSWVLSALAGFVVFLSVGASLLVTDYKLARWLRYFRRVALAHSGGHSSARAIGLRHLPAGLAELALQMNHMADSIDARSTALEHAINERTALLQEIHHRVKNNFAIVASLLSLHKKSLLQEFRPDIRFLEEHVHATAIAYRVAYAAKDTSSVPAIQLVREIIKVLQDIAGCPPENIMINAMRDDALIGLDKAIALGLCLAYGLPPFLDGCLTAGTTIFITLEIADDAVLIGFDGLPPTTDLAPALRGRLAEAYLRQLGATFDTISANQKLLHVPLRT